MNKICKQYISEVRAFFPVMGKSERKYVNKLRLNIENFCEEAEITSKQELYENYGNPHDVVNDYYSTVDTDDIIKKTHISKYIKIFIIAILALAVIAVSTFCIILYNDYQIATRQEAVIVEEVIE
ncbi:MAG: hypothetical protein J1E56_04155 [Ruminococcus sp.]|nr:hypothetical protein [Ruminococcus sp.]